MDPVRIPLAQLRDHLARCRGRDPLTKIALVLSASAAPGAYEAGVIDALLRQDVPIDVVVGSSGGAANGTLYLLDRLAPPVGECAAVSTWSQLSLDRVLSPAWLVRTWQRLSSLSLPLVLQWLMFPLVLPCKLIAICLMTALFPLVYCNLRLRGACFSSRPLRCSIVEALYAGLDQVGPGRRSEAWIGAAFGRRWQEADGPELIITATDLDALAPVLFTLAREATVAGLRAAGRTVIPLATQPGASEDRPGLLVQALMASSALFPFFPLQQVGDRLLGDGGYCAAPVDIAVEAGATHVLVVTVETPANASPLDRKSIWATLKRIAATMIAAGGRGDRRVQRFDIWPGATLLTFLEFDGAYAGGRVVVQMDWLIENGRRDAEVGFCFQGGREV